MVAGPLIALATLLHPSRETAATIIASEPRLVAAHVLSTVYGLLVLLGLPGLYAAHRGGFGRLGSAGFLTALTGTYLIAVTGYFGFMAPFLAKHSPAVLDAMNRYGPVVVSSGLAATTYIVGYAMCAGGRWGPRPPDRLRRCTAGRNGRVAGRGPGSS